VFSETSAKVTTNSPFFPALVRAQPQQLWRPGELRGHEREQPRVRWWDVVRRELCHDQELGRVPRAGVTRHQS
jgi:hypothetical protein